MLQKLDGIGYQSSLLSQFTIVKHAFSGRSVGDMAMSRQQRDEFAHMVGITTSPLLPEQVHGNRVQTVDKQSIGIISGVDGLVSCVVPIAVVAADCVPILFLDPSVPVFAAVHAGWKGTLGDIVGRVVEEMVRVGADKRAMYAVIGPHIGACCYDVTEARIGAFKKRFGRDEKMAFMSDGAWHLDIGWANYRQLIEAGIPNDHIDWSPTCTSCQNSEFFSYRKDSRETYGEMMAIIGL